jgi:Uma2 family endonuclease
MDRGHKGGLYARAGIADYWIVNLVERLVEVYRNPVAAPLAPFGWRYAERAPHGPGATIFSLAAPEARIPVEDLLP